MGLHSEGMDAVLLITTKIKATNAKRPVANRKTKTVPSCGVVSYFTSTVAITHRLPTMFPAVAPRCYSAREQKANQSVYTTAATRAATRSSAPAYCPIRVVINTRTPNATTSTVVPSYYTLLFLSVSVAVCPTV